MSAFLSKHFRIHYHIWFSQHFSEQGRTGNIISSDSAIKEAQKDVWLFTKGGVWRAVGKGVLQILIKTLQ